MITSCFYSKLISNASNVSKVTTDGQITKPKANIIPPTYTHTHTHTNYIL